jgi:hypothetical protein
VLFPRVRLLMFTRLTPVGLFEIHLTQPRFWANNAKSVQFGLLLDSHMIVGTTLGGIGTRKSQVTYHFVENPPRQFLTQGCRTPGKSILVEDMTTG